MLNVSLAPGVRVPAAEAPVAPVVVPGGDPIRFERALAGGLVVALARTPEGRLPPAGARPAPPGRDTPGGRLLAAMDRPAGDAVETALPAAVGDTPGSRVLDAVHRTRRRPGPEDDPELASVAAEAGRAATTARAADAAAAAARPVIGGAPRAGENAGHRSGLAWQTGFYNAEAGDYVRTLATDEHHYLGRGTDVFTSFWNHDSRETARRVLGSPSSGEGTLIERFRAFAERDIRLVQAVPLAMRADRGRIEDILHGSLRDEYVQLWRDLGTAMALAGNERPIVRLGWEMNLSSGGYAWNQSNGSVSPQQFVQLYRLAADAIRSTMPDAVLCWNPGKHTTGGHHIDEFYPGNEYVDIIGVDFYDNGGGGIPHLENDRLWDQYYMRTSDTGPVGIGAWYEYARSRGRQFAVPEWGLTDGKDGRWHSDVDRPEFIENMYRFFQMAAREGNLVFENYFNGPDRHQLYPVLQYHQAASATYRELFQADGSAPPRLPPPDPPPANGGSNGGGGTPGRPHPGPGAHGPDRPNGGAGRPRPAHPFEGVVFADDVQLALALFAQAFPQQQSIASLAAEYGSAAAADDRRPPPVRERPASARPPAPAR